MASEKASEPKSLSFRQRLFVEAYLGDAQGNATEAARIAGYAQPQVLGSRQLEKVEVRAVIDARLNSAALSASEVLARLSEHATGDVGDFLTFDKTGNPRLNLDKARKADRLRLVKKIKWTKSGLEFELYDAQAALDKLAKYHGLYKRDGSEAPGDDVAAALRDFLAGTKADPPA